MFRVGETIRCVSKQHMTGVFGYIKPGEEYVVGAFDPASKRVRVVAKGSSRTNDYWYPVANFERPLHQKVTLEGKVASRNNGTVSFALAEGETVLLPERLFPVDPKVLKYREVLADWVSPISQNDPDAQSSNNWADNIRKGLGDEGIQKLIEKHQL